MSELPELALQLTWSATGGVSAMTKAVQHISPGSNLYFLCTYFYSN